MQPHGRLHSDGTGATASRSNLRVEGDVDRDLFVELILDFFVGLSL